jgi:hypothetical protein
MRKASKSIEIFRRAPAFVINILADDQNEMSGRFASSRIVDKFEGVDWRPGERGTPVIAGSLASFECRTFAVHDAGYHLIFIGEVEKFEQGRQDEPLVFYKGAYMMLTQSLRELAARGQVDPHNLDQARRLVNCMLLRLACENGQDEDFDAIERNILEIEGYEVPEDREKRAEASLEFFRLITKAARNEVLVVVSETLTNIIRQVLKAEPSLKYRPELVPVRKKILHHLRQRDADQAEQEMTFYFDEMRRGAAAIAAAQAAGQGTTTP